MMMSDVRNLHMVEVRYLGATNHKPSRVVLESLRFPGSRVVVSRDTLYNSMEDQAVAWLQAANYTVVCGGENVKGGYILAVAEFEPLDK